MGTICIRHLCADVEKDLIIIRHEWDSSGEKGLWIWIDNNTTEKLDDLSSLTHKLSEYLKVGG